MICKFFAINTKRKVQNLPFCLLLLFVFFQMMSGADANSQTLQIGRTIGREGIVSGAHNRWILPNEKAILTASYPGNNADWLPA